MASDEAPVRRLIYELFDEHQRIKTVARILNERGYRTRLGKRWSDMAVRFQLKDPTAKGIHRRNYTRNQGQGKTWALKPESEHIFNEVEAIVPAELWERCNKLLDDRYMKRDRPAKKPAHLFSGYVYCSGCGKPMYVPTKSPKYTCQKCLNKIPCNVLEDLFMEEVKDYLIEPGNVQSYLAKAGEALVERQELLSHRQKEAAKIKADTDRMLRLYLDGSVSSEQFNQPLIEQTTQLDDEVARLQSEIDVLRIDSLSGEQLISEALDLHARWATMIPDEKRRVVEQMVRRIEIGDGEAHMHLIQLPSYKEITNWQNTYHPVLPFCHFTLKASRTSLRFRNLRGKGFKSKPQTLGEHLRSKRLLLKVTQEDAATRLDTIREQYDRWERDEVAPEISMWPKLIRFLGYYPAECHSAAHWVLRARRVLGLSQFAIGRKVRSIAENIRKWERGKAQPPGDLLRKFQEMAQVA